MSKEGGIPWPVWAIVTLLAAFIGTVGKAFVDRILAPPAQERPLAAVATQQLQPPTQTAQVTTLPPAAPPVRQADWTSRLGLYGGTSINRVAYARGATLFDLKSVEPSGRVRAVIGWSQGLSGDGTLVGTVSENTMDLSGTILSQETGIWDCDLKMTFTSDSSIRGTYRLFPRPGNPFGTQDGEFTLDRIR
jgi:hypothetical protein